MASGVNKESATRGYVGAVSAAIRENGFSVVISCALLALVIWQNYQLQNYVRTTLNDRIDESTKAIAANSEALRHVLEDGQATRDALKGNTMVLERVLNALERQGR